MAGIRPRRTVQNFRLDGNDTALGSNDCSTAPGRLPALGGQSVLQGRKQDDYHAHPRGDPIFFNRLFRTYYGQAANRRVAAYRACHHHPHFGNRRHSHAGQRGAPDQFGRPRPAADLL